MGASCTQTYGVNSTWCQVAPIEFWLLVASMGVSFSETTPSGFDFAVPRNGERKCGVVLLKIADDERVMEDDTRFPSQLAERFQIRMPDGMRDRIAEQAKANNRSMNAEIVATLREKYPDPRDEEFEQFMGLVAKLDPVEVARLTQLLLERNLASGKITQQDIDDGIIPGVGLRIP